MANKNKNAKPFLFWEGERDWPRVEAVSSLFCHERGLKLRSGDILFCIAAVFMLNKVEWSKNSNKFTTYCIVFFQRIML